MESEVIPDDAIVVRGGRNLPPDIVRGTGTHPSGATGVSVECAAGQTVEDLAKAIPHGQIGTTTVGRVRAAGGDVVRTSGRTANHATLTGLDAKASQKAIGVTAKGKWDEFGDDMDAFAG
jgi:hypothetical protein